VSWWYAWIIFVGTNLFLGIGFWFVKHITPVQNPLTAKFGATVYQAYPNWNPKDIDRLLEETWLARPFEYETFTEYKEREFSGTFVNVNRAGFRLSKDQGRWPISADETTVFLFGGSTTFNYGLADNETIASYLQSELQHSRSQVVKVYNFGRGFYYSTQERILFEQLLLSGSKPKLAIFIDGINEFGHPNDQTLISQTFKTYLDQPGSVVAQTLLTLPVFKLMNRFVPLSQNTATSITDLPDQKLQELIVRYQNNVQIISALAKSFSINTLFVWQPNPAYQYDISKHTLKDELFVLHKPAKRGYELFAPLKSSFAASQFLYLADIQNGVNGILYVDNVHYSALLSKVIAEAIARQVNSVHGFGR
jgi:hypothetical protein